MRPCSRILLALGFALLFLLIPSPRSDAGRAYLGVLQTRGFLLDASGPLSHWVADGAVPPLRVDLRLSPPNEALRQHFAAECERAGAEWAAARTIEARRPEQRVRLDDSLPPVPLILRVTELGAQAELPLPDGTVATAQWRHPAWYSLLPAFLAVILAILTGRIVPALLLGCLSGTAAHLVATGTTGWLLPVLAIERLFAGTLWHDVLGELRVTESGAGFQVRVILFVVFLFMAIGVMSRSGGIQGMVQWAARFARGPVSTQLCAWFTGLLLFFDDYSSCIVTGTTMQPLGDRNRVAREKIAYIVDSTAAPIAGLSIFSTWIAYEISQYRAPLTLVSRDDGTPFLAGDAYEVFVQTIPFRFYCLFTLALVGLVVLLRRDFGPMLTAERRARREGKPIADDARPMVSREIALVQAAPGTPLRARNGLLPVLLLVLLALSLTFLYGAFADGAWAVPPDVTGFLATSRWILGNSATEKALLWASLGALLLATALALGQRILTPRETLASALRAARALRIAIVILLLAWCIGQICKDLGTSYYLTAACRDLLRAELLPLSMFVLAGLIAFSTGTSFGTMAILLPNVVVLSHSLGTESGIGGATLMVLTIGAVLEGSIFGDHCSPISDTTVLSSLSTQCDHLHHVKTQIPYAVLSMVVAAGCGYLPMALLGTRFWWLSLVLGVGALAAFLLVVGRRPDRDGGAAEPGSA